MEVVFSNEAVSAEYERWACQIDSDDQYDTQDTVGFPTRLQSLRQ